MARQLETCPACRALLEPGTPVCPYCAAQIRPRRRGVWGALVNAYLQAPACYTLLLVILALFGAELGMTQSLGGRGASSSLMLARLGANVGGLNIRDGEWWRFATAIFLHIGVVHLLFNAWALLQLAPFCERVYGASRFLAVYLASGLAGNVVSYLACVEYKDAPGIHYVVHDLLRMGDGHWLQAGASGSLCGLLGLLMVFRTGSGWDIGAQTIRRMTGQWLLYTVLFGLFARADNAAHLGGAAAGALLGLLLGTRAARGRKWTLLVWRPAAAALAGLTLVAIGLMASSQGKWTSAAEVLAAGEDYDTLEEAFRAEAAVEGKEAEARAAVQRALQAFAQHPLPVPELARTRDDVVRAARKWLEGHEPAKAAAEIEGAMAQFEASWESYLRNNPDRLGLLLNARRHKP